MTRRTDDCWLLDLDGTLIDVEDRFVHEVMWRVGERLGPAFHADDAERLWDEHAPDRAAVLAARGAMAGDAPTDVDAARNAGLDAFHVDRGRSQACVSAGDRRISTLTAVWQ
jgi:phosphoglycolate phosphatase-like HAD superfamily hydrolase